MIDWTSNRTRVDLRELYVTLNMYGNDCRVVRWARAYRQLRNTIWWHWRRKFLSYFHVAPPKDGRLHVYFNMRGGIGDCAANRIAIMELRKRLPQAVFYFFCDTPGAASVLFPQDDKHVFLTGKLPLWYRYDMAFEVCLSFKTVHLNWKRINALAPEMIPLLQEQLKRQKQLGFLVQDNYLMDEVLGRFLAARGESQLAGQSYLSALDFDVNTTGRLPEELLNPDVLKKYALSGKKYITIHSGVNVLIPTQGRVPLKCWPEEKWREFVHLFKQVYPDILVVQLGGPNSPHFDFVDVCLVGRTPLTDLPALLNNALLHVDGENGFAQLMRWLKTKAVVFFGPTDCACFGLAKNRNLTANQCRPCMWLAGRTWYMDCPLGYPACQNTVAITPAQAFQAVQEEMPH